LSGICEGVCFIVSKLGYDSYVKRLNSATVAALALIAGGWISLALVPSAANAQINGVPASVTSTNFGGHSNSSPGVPASITSIGPNGIQPRNPFPHQSACCINRQFSVNSNPPNNQRRHHRERGQFFPGGGAVYIPYAYPVIGEPDPGDAVADQQENQPQEEYRGGPTIFDRRGPGEPAYAAADPLPSRRQAQTEAAPAPPPAETPVPDQPQTLLVFKDGHQLEVQNYAVIGDTLYDLTPGRHHKIALDELDLTSTAKQNDDRGIDFRLPPKPEATK
jgi:hypothetical protein